MTPGFADYVVGTTQGSAQDLHGVGKGCDFTKIQRAGDTIRVKNGTYREAVQITGAKKRYLKLVGNKAHPAKVLLRARENMQNGVAVNEADEVTVDGFMARGYKANGFFFTNLTGYTMDHLIARQTGVYGLYAFNTIGGTIRNSEAYYVNDGAFYIGQTPPQSNPVQTLVTNIRGLGLAARLQRDQHALRDDHEEPLLQQCQRRPEQRVRPQRHRRQRRRPRLRRQRHQQLLLAGGVTSTYPADAATFAGCGATNVFSTDAQSGMLSWIADNAPKFWNKHPHPAKAGYSPLEVFK
jgi:hypothetical protein